MEIEELEATVAHVAAESRFAGVVDVVLPSGAELVRAFGLADRRHRIPNDPDTRFGIASGTKGFTALAVVALVEDGVLALDRPVRDVLGPDLPDIDDRVTIEHLLAHRAGIGDYLDESTWASVTDHVMPVPVHRLSSTPAYLEVLAGHAQVFPPGERFTYNNGGFVVLALVAERVAGRPFEQLVVDRVCAPAGLAATRFERSDDLPADVATGYLSVDDDRTNVLHLPVLGSGDGGLTSSAADIRRWWRAVFEGRVVGREWVDEMVAPRSVTDGGARYGLGIWLAGIGPRVAIEGCDAGVSFRSDHDPTTGATCTVLSNTSDGAWPLVGALRAMVFDGPG